MSLIGFRDYMCIICLPGPAANPEPEVMSSRRIHNAFQLPSLRTNLWIRIHHWLRPHLIQNVVCWKSEGFLIQKQAFSQKSVEVVWAHHIILPPETRKSICSPIIV
jgi:hypothetical protein